MQKRGGTLTNYVLIIGLLLISSLVIINLKEILFFQVSQTEQDLAASMLKEITSAIEKIESYPSDAKYRIVLDIAEPYELNVTKSSIELTFPSKGLKASMQFFATNVYIVPSAISGSGIIYIYKKGKNIYLTNENKDTY